MRLKRLTMMLKATGIEVNRLICKSRHQEINKRIDQEINK